MKLCFLGAGKVGAALAVRLAKAGHDVVLAEAREGSPSVAAALARAPDLRSAPIAEAVAGAEIIFLATPYAANEGLVSPLTDRLAGKVLVDCTNPVGPGLSHGLGSARSGSQVLQALLPETRVVKAFTIYGYENFEDPVYPVYDLKPAMLFCGEDTSAKKDVATLITDCGFDPVDVGGLAQALHLEHMTLMWVRMVRAGGQSPGIVWAALLR